MAMELELFVVHYCYRIRFRINSLNIISPFFLISMNFSEIPFCMVYSHSLALDMVFVSGKGKMNSCLPHCGESKCDAESTRGQ